MSDATEAQARARTGRVKTIRAPGRSVLAEVEGRSGRYLVAIDPDGMTCTCPARGTCSHIRAVQIHTEGEPTMPEILDPETGEVHELTDDDSAPFVTEEPEPAEAVPAVASYDPDEDRTLASITDAPITWKTLTVLSDTDFVPSALRGRPAAVLGCVLLGREYGLPPMEALRSIDMVDGRPSPSAELLTRLIRRAGHRIEIVEASATRCTLRGVRADNGDEAEVTFTIEDAARVTTRERGNTVPLSETKRYLEYPEDLLWARAISRLHRRLFADVSEVVSA